MKDQEEAGKWPSANTMTIWSHIPAIPINAPTSKTLAEDVTHAELVARHQHQFPLLRNQQRSLA